jgi:hypothetical protein
MKIMGIIMGLYFLIGFVCGIIAVVKHLARYFAAGWRVKAMLGTLTLYTFFWLLMLIP